MYGVRFISLLQRLDLKVICYERKNVIWTRFDFFFYFFCYFFLFLWITL